MCISRRTNQLSMRCLFAYVWTNVCMGVYMYVWMCVCMHVCILWPAIDRRMCASLVNGNNPIGNRMRNRAIDTRVHMCVYACTDACAHRWTRRSNVQSTIEYAIDTRVCAHVQSSAASIDNCMKQDSLPCAFACVQSQSTLACGHDASTEQHNMPIRLAC